MTDATAKRLTAQLQPSDLTRVHNESRHRARCLSVLKRLEKQTKSLGPRTLIRLEHFRTLLRDACERTDVLGLERIVRTSSAAAETFACNKSLLEQRTPHTQLTRSMSKIANTRHRRRAQNDMLWRLGQIADECANWFWIFDTLTVRDEKVLADNRAWARYSRMVKKQAGECHHFAVVEKGAKNGRNHIHVLWIVKDLPPAWRRDPMRHANDFRREIDALKTSWPHGYSTPIAVRFSRDDAFGKIGWQWPRDRETRLPIDTGKPVAVGRYLSKYLQKEGAREWRPRLSRNLGLKQISRMLERHPLLATQIVNKRSPIHLILWTDGNRPSKSLLKNAVLKFALRERLNGRLSTAVRTTTTRSLLTSFYALPKPATTTPLRYSLPNTGTFLGADASSLLDAIKQVRARLEQAIKQRTRDNPHIMALIQETR